MADNVDPATRSRMMSRIRSKDTKPELLIRKEMHRLGFRYRLHVKALPGKPDLFFPKYNAVVFVHGCFWHGHDCHLFRWPKSREEWWREKIGRNQERDREVREEISEAGFRQGHVWECSIRGKSSIGLEQVTSVLAKWLLGDRRCLEIRGTI